MVNELEHLIENNSTFDKEDHMFLYHLYSNANLIENQFQVLVKIGDKDIYERFNEIFTGKKNDYKESIITQNITKLLQIDLNKTWAKLQEFNETFDKKKEKVRQCINIINDEMKKALSNITDQEYKQTR